MLGNIFNLNSYQLLSYSQLFNLLLIPLFAVAGKTDKKTHEVAGGVCIVILCLLLCHAICLTGSVWPTVLVLLCIFFTLGPIEFTSFGQADFLLLAHFFTAYTWTSTGLSLMFIAGIVWICCLGVHVSTYRDQYGNRWRPFKGIMIPAIPSYAVSMMIMAIARIFITRPLFYSGF